MFGANTTTGWMAILFAGIVSLLILTSRNTKIFKVTLSAVIIIGVFGIILLFTNSSFENLKNVIFGTYKADTEYGIKSIETTSDICIDYNGIKTHFTYDEDVDNGILTMYCLDDSGKSIDQSINSDGVSGFKDQNGAEYLIDMVYIGDDLGIRISIDDHQWAFRKLDDGQYYYFNAAGKYVTFKSIDQVEWFNEDAVSGRGHIWNKTIPKLLKHIFIGSGANSYLLEIPQEDYLYKNYTNTNNNFDVKAHNWYLQQWVENGLIATICLIAFYLFYFVTSVKIYRRVSFHEDIHKLGFAIFVGLLIYMIAALVNDPTVNVAPMYWGVLGLGFSVNRMIVESDELILHKVQPSEAECNVQHGINTLDSDKDKKKATKKKKSRKVRKLNSNR